MFGFCGSNEDILKEEIKRKEQIEEEEEERRTKQENREMRIASAEENSSVPGVDKELSSPKPMSIGESTPGPFFGSAIDQPSPLPAVDVSTWRDMTSPTPAPVITVVTSPPPTSSSFPGFMSFLDSVSGKTNPTSEEPSTPKSMPNPTLLPVAASEDDAVVLGSAIKMLQQQLTEEKQKNKSLKEQLDKENVATPVSFAPFSVDQSLRLGESFGTLFGMTEVGPSTNVAEDKPLVEESQTPPPPISSPFAIPSIRMSFFGATTEPPSSTLNADNEGSSTEYVPPVPTTFYSNMMPSIPFYGASKETEITTESSTVAAPMLQSQGPAIDVQVPPMSPIPAQSEVVPPSQSLWRF